MEHGNITIVYTYKRSNNKIVDFKNGLTAKQASILAHLLDMPNYELLGIIEDGFLKYWTPQEEF